MTEYDKENITEILHGTGTWFTAELFRLIAKSDSLNRDKLAVVYPEEVNVVHQHLTDETKYENKVIWQNKQKDNKNEIV